MSTRGVVDLLLCLDASKSMQPCFDGVRQHLSDFVSGLSAGGQQQQSLDLRVDYLAHSCGQEGAFRAESLRYRGGIELVRAIYSNHASATQQSSSSFFTTNMSEIERGLSGIQVVGDEAPLVALDLALDFPWRPRNKCHRVLVMMTDEPFESGTGMNYAAASLDGQRGKLSEIIDKCHALGVMLFLVAPDSDLYSQLSLVNKCQYKSVDDSGDGLRTVDFGEILSQIGKSVSVASLQSVGDGDIKRALFSQDEWIESSDPLRGA